VTAQDWVIIIGAVAAAIVTVLGAIGALYAKIDTHDHLMRDRLEKLLALTAESNHPRCGP